MFVIDLIVPVSQFGYRTSAVILYLSWFLHFVRLIGPRSHDSDFCLVEVCDKMSSGLVALLVGPSFSCFYFRALKLAIDYSSFAKLECL